MIIKDISTTHPGIPAGGAIQGTVLLWTTDQTHNDEDGTHD
jgi:hypothetical protein